VLLLRSRARKTSEPEACTQKTVMVKEKDSYPIRLDLRTRENFETYQAFETLMIMSGKDAGMWLSELVMESVTVIVKELEPLVLNNSQIVGGEALRKVSHERFGDRLTRNDLKILRQTVWTEGEEYYSAPNGKMKAFRYNLEKCLPALSALAAKRITF
jgi:hypothetical protein